MTDKSLTYEATGVRYDDLDPFKRLAQAAGQQTAGNIARLWDGEFREYPPSRGESAYLIEAAKSYVAFVVEGLGTKNLVADNLESRDPSHSYYGGIGQDTVAMIVNDLATLGALPLTIGMQLAVGESAWLSNTVRIEALIRGWKQACDLAGCTWGGGETPALKGVVVPGTAMISGAGMGFVKPKSNLITSKAIQPGDAIIIAESSGIHANGLTMARAIALTAPKGYDTLLSNGQTYGSTLLEPTHIYVRLIELCQNAGIPIHYAVNITGHGWRKFMRAVETFAYVIEQLPTQLPIFDFIQEHGPVDDREAYSTFNMGAGFAIFVAQSDVSRLLTLVSTAESKFPFRVFQAGHIEASDTTKVVIRPKGLEFAGDTLHVR